VCRPIGASESSAFRGVMRITSQTNRAAYPLRPPTERGWPLLEQGNDMTKLKNEICDPSIDELSIEEMDAVTGGDSAILQLAKLAGAAAVYAGGGHFGNIATTLP
jgi:hypothetical protein